jgi:hypothetical protein
MEKSVEKVVAGPILIIVGNGSDGSIGIINGKIVRVPPRSPLIDKIIAAVNAYNASETMMGHEVSSSLRTASEKIIADVAKEIPQVVR